MEVKIVREQSFDVVVCGGGTAGFCAAIAAARNGAKTAVIERFGAFGGTMTIGGVCAPAMFHAHGRQIISGIAWELMTTLVNKGYATLPPEPYNLRHPQMSVELNAFQAEVEIDRMIEEAGVSVFFHQSVVYAESGNGHVSSVLISTNGGLEKISAKVFIDCTGDANVCRMAGAEIEISDELQPASLNSIFMNVSAACENKEEWIADFRRRVEAGEMDQHDIWGLNAGAMLTGHGRARGEGYDKPYVINIGNNLNHVYPFNGADNESRTKGEMEARRSIARVVEWMRGIPGYENAYVASCSPVVSARESARVVGNAYVTGEDYVNGKTDETSVCYSFYPIDVHRGRDEKAPLDNEYHSEGKVPGMPYGSLVAKGFDNLMMAGRIASGDRRAQSAYRIQASCMAMGEAAGTAAAIAVKGGTGVDAIDVALLRRTLHENGAIVPGME